MTQVSPPVPVGLMASLGKREIGLVATLFCVATLILGFGLLANEVMAGDTMGFDTLVARLFRPPGANGPVGPAWLHEMARDVTSLGSMVILCFLSAVVVGYLLMIRKRGAAALLVGSILGGTAISFGLKLLFDRPRPEMPGGIQVFTTSFPSSHAMLSAVTYLTLGALMTRVAAGARLKAYFMGLAVLLTVVVGLSRVYVGVHYATDVLAGWCVGSAWAVLCWIVALQLQRRGQVEKPGAGEGIEEPASPS
ncbi:phosphatase PAP2 family protein [Methylobacterium phyllosphaerae]